MTVNSNNNQENDNMSRKEQSVQDGQKANGTEHDAYSDVPLSMFPMCGMCGMFDPLNPLNPIGFMHGPFLGDCFTGGCLPEHHTSGKIEKMDLIFGVAAFIVVLVIIAVKVHDGSIKL